MDKNEKNTFILLCLALALALAIPLILLALACQRINNMHLQLIKAKSVEENLERMNQALSDTLHMYATQHQNCNVTRGIKTDDKKSELK